MSVYGINLDLFSSSPIVILKVEDENRYLPIWIGQPEARSILMKLQNQEFSRPLTHDLAFNLDGRSVEVDSRPSDAIAIAVRAGAPIFAADEVIEEAAVVFEEAMEETPEDEVVDKFKDWMNQITPEDFK
jgi:bifunctional DNase/RNase